MEWLRIIDELEDYADDLATSLQNPATKLEEEILAEVEAFIETLELNRFGGIKQSVSNLKAVNKFSAKLNGYVAESDWAKSSSEFMSAFQPMTEQMDRYFSAIVSDYKASEVLAEQLFKLTSEVTLESLAGTGIDANVIRPVTDLMTDNVLAGADRKAIRKAIKEYLVDNHKIVKYSDQIAVDTIAQYNANYLATVGSGLKLEYFYYKGTKIQDSRSFCIKHAGKAYTAEEFRLIVTTESAGGGWQGMVPGTNWSNFKTYRGGYRCRHYMLPISKGVYEFLRK